MSPQLPQLPLPPPQTVEVFPNSFTRPLPSQQQQQQQQQHSHSSGSFGTVFLVLAVVLAVSAIACCLGRLCNRRSRNSDPSSKQNRRPHPRVNDIESGFDGRTQTTANPIAGKDPRGNDNEFGFDGRSRTADNPIAGKDGGSQIIQDKDKAGLGGGFQFQTRAKVDEPNPSAQ